MEVEIFTLCDFSQLMDGKSVIIGAFDTLYITQIPTQFPTFYITGRIRFHNSDSGYHSLQITISDANGISLGQPINTKMRVNPVSGADSTTSGFDVTVIGLPIKSYGKLLVALSIDGKKLKELPFFVAHSANTQTQPN